MDTAPSLQIALAFSGGGFRAACFCLGSLTFLDRITIQTQTLLQQVSVLSTVSGGTITGARYAIGLKQGETIEEVYHALHAFMRKTNLVELALEQLVSDKPWEGKRMRSMINAFADIYDTHLFAGAPFAVLLSDEAPTHLKHVCFNTTEFANALQFRFQATEPILSPEPGAPVKGVIGNYYYRIPVEVATAVRMGDILAASSCFPGGFEPINFPDDFVMPESHRKALLSFSSEAAFPVGLMDGGIVDNQGIEPVLLAEARMQRNRNKIYPDDEELGNVLDLIIVSDVASPFMKDYKPSVKKKKNWWRVLTPATVFSLATVVMLGSAITIYIAVINDYSLLTLLFTFLFTISVAIFLLAGFIKGLPEKFKIPAVFLKPFGKLLRLKFLVYENLIMNRVSSLMQMTNEVFLKHVRRLNYRLVFNDPAWINRRIMNAIYELREGETNINSKLSAGTLPIFLAPSDAIKNVATTASSMGTTLWFTEEELEKRDMLNVLIACGHFTLCWNLLKYIGDIKKSTVNLTPQHQGLIACEVQLQQHWKQFQEDPLWLVKELNTKAITEKVPA